MQHFSDQAWADLIRGIKPPQREEMESHLAKGCLDCTVSHNSWKQVQAVALRESSFGPPENAVRMAKLIFAENSGADQSGAELASLTFDTFAQPALAGVRSAGAATARQMVYEADGLAVDLRFDFSPLSKTLSLTGQVLDKQLPGTPLQHSEVILWTQKGLPVAETKTNAFGEFNLEFEPQNHLRLSIRVIGRSHVRIHLANLRPEPDSDTQTSGSEISNQ
jgi:hypothetical protein